MSNTRNTGFLTNVVKYTDKGDISFVSGSTTLMSISSSGAVTVTGVISGSNALTSSYSQNSELLDNLDSTSFVFTSSFNTYSSSMSTRVTNTESTGSTLTSASASLNTASGSFSTRVTRIEGNYATTGSNVFLGAQTVCDNITSTGTIIAQTLNVQQVTSSVVYSSGSNVFGCSLTNTQQFTGSVTMTGSLNVAGNTCVTSVCSPAIVGGTFSGTTVYGSTAICGGVICGGAATLTGALSGTSATFSGNVGLNYTPSATGANARALQLTNYGTVSGNGNIGNISLAANAYESADNTWNRVNATSAGLYQISYTGAHTWYYAGASTAGSAIAWTQAFSIANTGAATFSSTIQANSATLGGIISSKSDGTLGAIRITKDAYNRLTIEDCGSTNMWNIDNKGGTLRIFREDYNATGLGANGSVKLLITNVGISCFACQVCVPTLLASGCILINATSSYAKLTINASPNDAIGTQSAFIAGTKSGYAGVTGLWQNQLFVYDNSATATGVGGAISFGGNAGSTQETWFGVIEGIKENGTSLNYAGALIFRTRADGVATPAEKMRITSAGRVGIGICAPNEVLDVNGTIQVRGESAGYATTQCVTQLDFYLGAARLLSFGGNSTTCGCFRFYSAGQNNSGGSDVAIISGGGVACFRGAVCTAQILTPSQPSAAVGRCTGWSGICTILWDAVHNNNGSHYNASTGLFTAPVAGYYLVSLMAMTNGSDATLDIELQVNSVTSNTLVPYQAATGGSYNQVSGMTIINVAANDTLSFKLNGGSIYGAGGGRHSSAVFRLLG